MPEHTTREQRVLYDHEDTEAPRRRPADDWGIDESFPRVRGRRFARTHEGPPRSRRRPIRINGRPGEVAQIAPFTSSARRRRPPLTVEERLAGDPTRIIAWAFVLGLILILIAILTS